MIPVSQLPPYRSLPSRFCTAAVLILIGILALHWAWQTAQRLWLPALIVAVLFAVVWAAHRRSDRW